VKIQSTHTKQNKKQKIYPIILEKSWDVTTSMTIVNREDQRGSKHKRKTQLGAANWKRIFSATGCNRC
jgi:hypothetical protein